MFRGLVGLGVIVCAREKVVMSSRGVQWFSVVLGFLMEFLITR